MGRPKEGYSGLEVSADKVEPDEDAEVDVQVLDTYRVEDLALGASDVDLVGQVLDTDSIRTFDRDDGSEGRVANLTLGDETGRVRVTLWDDKADLADEFEAGEVVEVGDGYVRERDGDLELHVGDRGTVERVDEDVEYVPETTDIADLEIDEVVDIGGGVIETDPKRTFDRDDGSEGRVANLTVGDETGRVRVTLWDDKADLADEFEAGEVVEVGDGYVRERDGDLELHVGDRGTVERVDEDVEYVPETTDIDDLEIGETVDVGGGVIETDPKRTFDRDDGSEGQVRNVRIKDETGEIRVALWGDKADREIELADRVVFTDVEIQDGWQDDLEASANWRSTVSVLDEGSDAAAGVGGASGSGSTGGDGADRGADETGLGAFAEDGQKAAAEAVAGEGGDDGSGGAATATTEQSGGAVEFTGTVVQTGDPVVLDDGQQTRTVDTDASLRLGEEITVRGPERDGTIDADDVF